MRYVIGNWKMAPATWREAEGIVSRLARELPETPSDVQTIVCPPLLYLHPIASRLGLRGRFALGAQDVHYDLSGAHTGEVSTEQLADIGLGYVIVGHSERRALGETNEVAARKVQAVLAMGMTAILCVGERTREEDWHAFLIEEVDSVLSLLPKADVARLVVAYEPIWAVGADEPDTPESAQTSALLIRKVVQKRFGESVAQRLPVIYGGSVNAKNIRQFATQEGLNGVLVGRASRDAAQFVEVVQAYIEL